MVAPNGTALTDEFLINQNTTGNQAQPRVAALSNGNAFVGWYSDRESGATWDVSGRVLAPNGTAFTNDFTINQNITGTQYGTSVAALSNSNTFVVWEGNQAGTYDIYGRVVAPNGTALSNDFTISQVTNGQQYEPSVAALSNGNTLVVWWGDQAGTRDIYGRVLAPNGTALTNEFLINQNTTGTQAYPSVAALSNGNAFVVWLGTQTGTYEQIAEFISGRN